VADYLTPTALRLALAGSENLTGTAADLSDADLTDAIEQAQAEVDGRLSTLYDTPFAAPSQIVIDITRDIAAYLATLTYRRGDPLQPGEAVTLRYTRAQQMLKDASKGDLPLPSTTGSGTEMPATVASVSNPYDGDLFQTGDFGIGPAISPTSIGSPTWPDSARW
jgi:phage gp36-like protein